MTLMDTKLVDVPQLESLQGVAPELEAIWRIGSLTQLERVVAQAMSAGARGLQAWPSAHAPEGCVRRYARFTLGDVVHTVIATEALTEEAAA